jgi:hypothetical protein
MTNNVVGGIRNGVAGGGAARATVKNAMAHNCIASRRWNTNAIWSLLTLGLLGWFAPNAQAECDDRCSASHRSLIEPSGLSFTALGIRILRMTTTVITTMTAPTISHI